MTMPSIFISQLKSGVLDSRHPSQVKINDNDVATKHWRGKIQRSMKRDFNGRPAVWPKEFNKILNPKRTWASPIVTGYWHGANYVTWLRAWWKDFRHRQIGPAGAWWSRLVPDSYVLVRRTNGLAMWVLCTSRWTVRVCDLEEKKKGLYVPTCLPRSIHHVFLAVPSNYRLYQCVEDRSTGLVLALQIEGPDRSLVQAALLDRYDFQASGCPYHMPRTPPPSNLPRRSGRGPRPRMGSSPGESSDPPPRSLRGRAGKRRWGQGERLRRGRAKAVA